MKKNIGLVLLLGGILLCGCTANFDKYNKDVYGITDAQLASLPIGSNDLQTQLTYAFANQENAWQMYNDLPGIYSGYCAATNFVGDFNTYSPRVGWVDYIYNDNVKYIYQGYNAIKDKTKGNLEIPSFAMSTILRAGVTQRLADIYGPLPYSKVNGVDLKVAYDSHKDLYFYVLEDLKKATEQLEKYPSTYDLYAPFDNLYNGDMQKWAKFGRSLMLRMAVRMAKQEPEKAKEYAEYAVNKGVITTNEETAQIQTQDNPCYKIAVSWADSRVGADIVEYMVAFSDPRVNAYFTQIPERGNKPFGYRGGSPINIKNDETKIKLYSCPNITKTSPIVWISAAEVAFLKAEGALNNWNMGKSAKDLYADGINLSCKQWGVSVGDYLTNRSKRGGFTDSKVLGLNNTGFSSNITVNWGDAQGDKEKELSKIITQKWIAMFPYGTMEAWAEWRRTGYPNLMPYMVNNSVDVRNITQENGKDVGGMRRLKYSSSELAGNLANVEEAIKMLEGPDSFATNLWWAK